MNSKSSISDPGLISFIDDAHTFGGAQVALAWAVRVLIRNTEARVLCVCSSETQDTIQKIAGINSRIEYIACPSALPLNLFTFPLRLFSFYSLIRRLQMRGVQHWWMNLSGIEFCLAPTLVLKMLGLNPKGWLHNTERFAFFYQRSSYGRKLLGTFRDYIADHYLFGIYKLLITPSESSSIEVNRRVAGRSVPQVDHLYYPTVINSEGSLSFSNSLKADDSEISLWMIGRIEYGHKDNEAALRVLRRLLDEGRKVHLSVVGSGPDEEAFKRQIVEWNLSSHVTCHGWQKDPWQSVPAGAIIFIPSVYESMSLVAREAMIRGLRLVASPIPVFREWIPAGLLASDFSPEAYVKALDSCLKMDIETVLELYRMALSRFSDDLFVSRFSYYNQIT